LVSSRECPRMRSALAQQEFPFRIRDRQPSWKRGRSTGASIESLSRSPACVQPRHDSNGRVSGAPQRDRRVLFGTSTLSVSQHSRLAAAQRWSLSLIQGEFYWICVNAEAGVFVARRSNLLPSTVALAIRGSGCSCICCTPPDAGRRVAERSSRRRCAEDSSTRPMTCVHLGRMSPR
jgi:hypothetical protein